MKKCSICDVNIETEDAPILVMGGAGVPKYLCEACAADLDVAMLGKTPDEISGAISRIGEKMANYDPDSVTYKTVLKILEDATARLEKIKEGTYDFALDEAQDEGAFDEIPEELEETEEDRELDRQDEEKAQKVDKFFNWVSLGLLIGAAIFVIWRVLDTFVF